MLSRFFVMVVLAGILALSPFVGAQEFYADIVIRVDQTGLVTISGLTNHPELQNVETHKFTSKEGERWLLNITIDGMFSDYVYDVRLPGNAVINYLKVPGQLSIESDMGELVVTGAGKKELFYITIQYTFDDSLHHNNPLIYSAFAAALLAAGYFLYRYLRSPGKKYNPESLTERQKLILDFLNRRKKPVTQREIEISVRIPKSSVSRNINTLVRKGIIAKERKGMSNIIYLRK